MSKYKNIFAKGHSPNCPEEAFVITKIKNTVLWSYKIYCIVVVCNCRPYW